MGSPRGWERALADTLWRELPSSQNDGGEKVRAATVVSREIQSWDRQAAKQIDSNVRGGALADTLWRELPGSQSEGEESRFAIKDVEKPPSRRSYD